MTDIETSLQGVVDSLLKTQPIVFSSKDCNSSASDSAAACTFAVWSSFRVYADVLLVIGLLVAVFGEAVGGGLIDAYTARKMLPRVVVAAILINLSIYIVAIMEDIVNILAAGVYDLISEPFKAAGVWHLNFNGASADLSGFAMIAAFLGSALAIHSLLKAKELGDAVIALAFLVGVPVLLAILGVIVTILFRTGILILLVMVSPIAFSAYVLPNTEQYFKKWWKLLMETLLVYPIVNLVFAMATVTGIVISRSGVGGIGWIGQILGAVAVVAPLFLIPYAFKFAGSTMGAIHDTVMNYKNRAHGALKGDEKNPNSLHNRMRRRLGNARNEAGLTGAQIGENFNPRNNIFTAAGRARRTARIGSRREAGQALLGQQAMESDPIIQANKNNDKFLTAVANRKHAETLRAKALKDGETATVAAWDQALSAASQVHGDAATRHAAAQAWAATGYNLGTGQEGYNQLAETMAAVTGAQLERDASGNVVGVKAGDPNAGAYANAMNSAQFNLKNAGRFDLAGINDGKGYNAELGLGKVDPYTMASRAKPDTIKQKGAMMRESLAKAKDAAQAASDARRAGNAKEADRQMAIYNAEMHNAEVHRIEMDTIRDNATGKNKSTAEEEMATVAGDADLASWRDGVIRDKSGAAETIDSRINYINDTATPGWSAEEKARGWRTERVQKTKGMQARADAQGGRRPNPSELEEH